MATPTPIDLAERVYLEAIQETERIASARGTLAAMEAAEAEGAARFAMVMLKLEAGQCGRVGCREDSTVGLLCGTHAPKAVAS